MMFFVSGCPERVAETSRNQTIPGLTWAYQGFSRILGLNFGQNPAFHGFRLPMLTPFLGNLPLVCTKDSNLAQLNPP